MQTEGLEGKKKFTFSIQGLKSRGAPLPVKKKEEIPRKLEVNNSDYYSFYHISDNRFHLCLNEHLGLVISDEDFDFLVRKYGQEKPGMINYKAFEEAMGKCKFIINYLPIITVFNV